MNRIREIRQRKKMSAQELANLVGTAQSTIHRLETGQQRLTDIWMEKIARALNVEAIDLLVIANKISTFHEEVKFFEHGNVANDRHNSNVLFQVTSNSLDYLGFQVNEVRSFSIQQADLANVKTGDVVIHAIRDEAQKDKEVLVLRQFVAPSLLVANSKSLNLPTIDINKVPTTFIAIQK